MTRLAVSGRLPLPSRPRGTPVGAHNLSGPEAAPADASRRRRAPYGGAMTQPTGGIDGLPRGAAGAPVPTGPAVLVAHDPHWAVLAAGHLTAPRTALTPLVAAGEACAFDHIGSTAVPGLAAKASVDLQVRVPVMPDPTALDAALAPLGWAPAPGSRPDSPGVVADIPTPGDDLPGWVWAKRLFTATDPGRPAILHIRLTRSPFGRRTLAFRDRLRAEPDLRDAYQQLKVELAAVHADDADYDDYTRAKTTFIRAATPQ